MKQLQQVCAWCEAIIRRGALPVSHGICAKCSKKFAAEIREKP